MITNTNLVICSINVVRLIILSLLIPVINPLYTLFNAFIIINKEDDISIFDTSGCFKAIDAIKLLEIIRTVIAIKEVINAICIPLFIIFFDGISYMDVIFAIDIFNEKPPIDVNNIIVGRTKMYNDIP